MKANSSFHQVCTAQYTAIYVILCVNEADISWLYILVYFATDHFMHVKGSQLELQSSTLTSYASQNLVALRCFRMAVWDIIGLAP